MIRYRAIEESIVERLIVEEFSYRKQTTQKRLSYIFATQILLFVTWKPSNNISLRGICTNRLAPAKFLNLSEGIDS